MRSFALPARTPRAVPLKPKHDMALARPDWPGAAAPDKAAAAQNAGERFEAMIISQLLTSSRPKTSLAGQTPLTSGQEIIDQQIDRMRAELMAREAPLGIGKSIGSAEQ